MPWLSTRVPSKGGSPLWETASMHAPWLPTSFVDAAGLHVLTYLRDTQNYVHLAAQGLTLFDVSASRAARDLAQWQPLCDWLENRDARV